MSKESYRTGFCKKAAAHNIDPQALARFAVQKAAAEAAAAPAAGAASAGGASGAGAKTSVWQNVMAAIEKAKAAGKGAAENAVKWYGAQDATTKALIGAGLGSAAGTGLGAALAGKKGLRAGAILGAVGGAGATVDWKALSEHLGKLSAQGKAEADAAAKTPAAKTQGAAA